MSTSPPSPPARHAPKPGRSLGRSNVDRGHCLQAQAKNLGFVKRYMRAGVRRASGASAQRVRRMHRPRRAHSQRTVETGATACQKNPFPCPGSIACKWRHLLARHGYRIVCHQYAARRIAQSCRLPRDFGAGGERKGGQIRPHTGSRKGVDRGCARSRVSRADCSRARGIRRVGAWIRRRRMQVA